MSDLGDRDHAQQSSGQDEEETAAPGKASLSGDKEGVKDGSGDFALGRMEVEDATPVGGGGPGAVQAEHEESPPSQQEAAGVGADIDAAGLNNGGEMHLVGEDTRAPAEGDLGHGSVHVVADDPCLVGEHSEATTLLGQDGVNDVSSIASQNNAALVQTAETASSDLEGAQGGTADAGHPELKAQDRESGIGQVYTGAEYISAKSPDALAEGAELVNSVQLEGARDAASGTGYAPIIENVENGGGVVETETEALDSSHADLKRDISLETDDGPILANGVETVGVPDFVKTDLTPDVVVELPGSSAASSPGILVRTLDGNSEDCFEKGAVVDNVGSDEPGSVKEDDTKYGTPVQVREEQLELLPVDGASSEEEFRVRSGYDKEADSSMDSTANSAAKPHAYEARVSQEEANSSSSEDSASSRPQTKLRVLDQPKKRIDLGHQFVREIVKIQHDREQFEKQVQADKQNASSVTSQDARNMKDPSRRQGRGPPTRTPTADESIFQVGSFDRQSEAPVFGGNVERKVYAASKGRASSHSNREKEAEEVTYHQTGKDAYESIFQVGSFDRQSEAPVFGGNVERKVYSASKGRASSLRNREQEAEEVTYHQTGKDISRDEVQERSHRGRTRSSKPHRFMPIYRPPNAREVALLDDEAEDVADSESVGYEQSDQVVDFDVTGVASADYPLVKGKDKGSARASVQAGNRKVHCVDPQALEEKREGLGIKITLDTTRHQRFVEYLDPAAETEATKFIVTIPGDGPSHNSDSRLRGMPSKGNKNEGIGSGPAGLDRATIFVHPSGPPHKGTKQEGVGATLERATTLVQPSGPAIGGTKQESTGPGLATLDRATIFVQSSISSSKGIRQDGIGSGSATLDRATIFVHPSGPSSFQFNARPEDKPFDMGSEKGKGFASSDRGRLRRGKNRARERTFSQGASGKVGHPQLARVTQRAPDQVYNDPGIIPRKEIIEKQRLDGFIMSEERSRESAQATSMGDLTKPLLEYQPSSNHEQPTSYPRISGRWGDIVEDVQEATTSPTEAKLENRPFQAHRRWGDDSDTDEGQETISPRTSKRRVKTAAPSFQQVNSGKSLIDSAKIGPPVVRQERLLGKDRDGPRSDPRKRESGLHHHRQGKSSVVDVQASYKPESSPKKNVWERLGPQKDSSRIQISDDQVNLKGGGAAKFSSQDWRKYQNSGRDVSVALPHDEFKEGLSSGHGSNAESDISHISEDSADALLQACKDSKQKRSKFELYVPRRGFSGS